ncbi:TetR/AcrR family transcriptional regulator [Streptosporangium sp. 'caverna']|uniref:TetR/AcrR family transcriptional regulator n=1 Tax=Streptosporangium sp. 'caverna' TaxID=2202249 RepID=UPI0019551448|nr:TetR/AcrR family transcriptional regulator [Streptosporangium sp. 'caverna']
MDTKGRPLRADAERSIRAIMEAAEQLLSENPGATMEQIAEAAGVARTTIHRRFASREALVEIMTTSAWREIGAAVEAARPHTAPPLVAMHQATTNVLQIKSRWRFALNHVNPLNEEAAGIEAALMETCDAVFLRAREAGILPPGTDLLWTRRVYLALLNETCDPTSEDSAEPDPDTLAARIIDTLLYGVKAR